MSRRVAILGAGRLGEALVRGFIASGWRDAADLVVTARRQERLADLAERYGVDACAENSIAATGTPLVIIAVKPQDITAVLGEIAPIVEDGQTIVSVAAGTTTAWIESHLPDGARVVRAMPNAPALVDEGI